MTVDALRIQNFMAFEETDWLELLPITLLFGRNSSGKSVLIRALLLLRQSLRATRDGQPFVFSDPYGVDLGGFREMVHRWREESQVWFHFRCTSVEIEHLLATSQNLEVRNLATPTLQISLGYAAYRDAQGQLDLSRIELTDLQIQSHDVDGEDGELLFKAILLSQEDAGLFGDENWYVDGLLTQSNRPDTWKGFGCQIGRGFSDVRFTAPKNESDAAGYSEFRLLFQKLKQEIDGFLENIIHLGPIRPEPQRRYSFSRTAANEWERHDWTAFRDFIGGKLDGRKRSEINDWLKNLDLAQNAEPRLSSENGALFTEFEIALQESTESRPVSLTAMGYGASQVLPIIVQCIVASPESLIIIEQPELHLHPAAQAALGDIFLTIALRKQPDPPAILLPSPPRFLLETHSEHLVLRMMRRMRNTTRKELPAGIPDTLSENIAVCVTTRNQEQHTSHTHRMEVSSEGQLLEPWPGGFFEEDFLERFS